MKSRGMLRRCLPLFAIAVSTCLAEDSEFTAEAFRNPSPEFCPGFFWMWNDRLDASALKAQLATMAANGVRNVCVHPFPREFHPDRFPAWMSPPYLSDEYLKVYAEVAAYAGSLGMHFWFYDEGGWPSGGAAGRVAASDTDGRWQPRLVGFGKRGNEPFGVRTIRYEPGRANYPSMIEPGATGRFLELTHEKVRAALGPEFGKTVKMVFTDEPEYRQVGWQMQLAWATDFPEVFKARKGYDIRPLMEQIVREKLLDECPSAEMRLDYYDVLADLFVERFLRPCRDWCRRNGLVFGGHLNCDDEPESCWGSGCGSILRGLREMDAPGVDVIWRQLWPGSASSHPRKSPFPRYASSARNQIGGRHAVSETFGIYGNSLTPQEKKWVCDYQMVRGVDIFLFAYYAQSNRRQWMKLFEPLQGPVQPMWDFELPFYRYVGRMCSFLSKGRPATEVAVFHDTRAFWLGGRTARMAADLQDGVDKVLNDCNCPYDFVEDDQIARADIADGALKVGAMRYTTLVVPSFGKMREPARAKVRDFAASGGRVLTPDRLAEAPRPCKIIGLHSDKIRVLKRVSGDRTVYFLVNEALHPTERLGIEFPEAGPVALCDPETGRFVAVERESGVVRWRFHAAESCMFVLGAPPEEPAARAYRGTIRRLAEGWTIRGVASYELGQESIVVKELCEPARPTALGDWRDELGRAFSGKAIYRLEFDGEHGGAAQLDLGDVRWTCSVSLNGERLSAKYFGPFVWPVMLKPGRNVLEVTVANTFANATGQAAVRSRIERDHPHSSNYDRYQAKFDEDNHSSGLFGPVVLRCP